MRSQALLAQFQCLGEACADNCCNSWAVKVDAPTHAKWQAEAPELLNLATHHESAGTVIVMSGKGGCCPKLEQGLCTIHRDKGEAFLTDACSLYPRITRKLGDTITQAASLSCPEIARLALFEEAPFALQESPTTRLPSSLKDYLPEGMNAADALGYHQGIIDFIGTGQMSAEQVLSNLVAFAHAHNNAPIHQWPQLIAPPLPNPKTHPNDSIYLIILLATLVQSAGIQPSARLLQIVQTMESVLGLRVQWGQATVDLTNEFPAKLGDVETFWKAECAEFLEPLLLRMIQAQCAASCYPFAGFGNTPALRATWIAVVFAAMRLSLACVCKRVGGLPTEEEAVLAIQPLARIFDHVSNPALVLPMLEEAGWLQCPRALGLVQEPARL